MVRTTLSWRSRWPWGWRAAICWAVLGGCLCWPARLPGLTQSETEQIESIVAEWRLLHATLTKLRELSSEQTRRSADLEQQLGRALLRLQQLDAKLTLWQEHSETLSEALERSSAELATSRGSLARLRSDLAGLEKAYSDYKRASDQRIEAADRRAAILLVIAIVMAVIAAGAGAAAAVR